MAIHIGSGLINNVLSWINFKSIVNSKGLLIQYEDDISNNLYNIYAIDGLIVYSTVIFKGTIPTASDTTQGQNDSDKTDFIDNFLSYANKPVNQKSNIIAGYTTTTNNNLISVRATAYTEQTTNAQRSVFSSSTSDTSAGVGARTVKVTYFDQVLSGPFTETVTLNGTSFVNTVATNICFIERIEVITVGSSLSNVGTITLKAATAGGGATIGTIPAGDGITNWCHHYVGANKIMSLVSIIGTIKGQNNGSLEVRRTIPTDITRPELTIAPKVRISSGTTDTLTFDVPILINGPALVIVYARSDATTGNLDWSVGMGYYEG